VRLTVEWRLSCRLVGIVVKWFAVTLALPIVVAIYYGDSPTPFVVTAAACLPGGFGLEAMGTEGDLGPREGLLMVAASWFLVPLLGAVPFVLAGTGPTASPVNALFESMSGVSTTGATVFLDFDVHPRSLLMWRQMLQWIGGLGILVIATAILSELGVGGAQLMETESQTRSVRRLTTKISSTARIIWGLYIGLTVLHIAVLYALHHANLAPNMTFFNAVAHPLSSISTAGEKAMMRSGSGEKPAGEIDERGGATALKQGMFGARFARGGA
jgi:trk system potassium uptake protein TrkH